MNRRIIIAAAVAFAVKILLAVTTYGTNDVLTWEADLRTLQTRGAQTLYLEGARPTWQGNSTGVKQQFNHPPFVLRVLQAWAFLADATGLPFRAWLRVTCALADIAMLWLVCGVLRAEKIPMDGRVLLGVALSPASIFVSGFHGNTDPIMVCFLVLSVYLITTRRPIWLAGAAFGMAMNIKVVPAIFLPVVLLSLSSVRSRIAFAVPAAAVFLVGSMPYLAHDPALVIHNVFGYTPGAGLWGFPTFAHLISAEALAAYVAVGKYLAPGAVLLASFWIDSRAPNCPIFVRCGLAAFVFLFFAPGFGMQYLVWLVPWSAALSWKTVRWHHAIVAADLFLFYAVFSRWQWHLANTFDYLPPSIALVGILQTVCWISVGMVAAAYGRYIVQGARRASSRGLDTHRRVENCHPYVREQI
jgi:hypothetical protein